MGRRLSCSSGSVRVIAAVADQPIELRVGVTGPGGRRPPRRWHVVQQICSVDFVVASPVRVRAEPSVVKGIRSGLAAGGGVPSMVAVTTASVLSIRTAVVAAAVVATAATGAVAIVTITVTTVSIRGVHTATTTAANAATVMFPVTIATAVTAVTAVAHRRVQQRNRARVQVL